MQQEIRGNNKYEILTPNGWESFDAVFKNENADKPSRRITLSNGVSVTATLEHVFYKHCGTEIPVVDIEVGDVLKYANTDGVTVTEIEDIVLETTYDIFNAQNHVILVNGGILSHQCDELAFLVPKVAREFWTSLSPTLATGGKVIITSTPNTDEDQFAEIWFGANRTIDSNGNETELGENGFKAYFADWKRHPLRDEAWAAAERASIGDARFEREHACQFITFEETLINPMKLAELKPKLPIRNTGKVRWYETPSPDRTYIVALDPSMGTGGDNAAIQVIELPTLRQVAEWCSNKDPIEEQIRTLKAILEEIQTFGKPECYWSVESNTLGEAALVVIRDTGEENFPGTMLHDPKNRLGGKTGRRAGFVTTNKSKLESCARLKHLIESGKLTISSRALAAELKVFVSRSNTFEARPGQRDDLVMSLILALRMIEFVSTWDDQSHAAVTSNINDEDDSYDSPMPLFI